MQSSKPLGRDCSIGPRCAAAKLLFVVLALANWISVAPLDAQLSLSAAWSPVGPPQVTSQKYGAVTGRVTSIAVDPNDTTGNTVYVGTTGGGVWKSSNAAGPSSAVRFSALTDTLPVFSGNAGSAVIPGLSIGAVSVGDNVVLAGTGDPNDALDSYYGVGILRSADGGVTWTVATDSNDGVAGSHSFKGLAVAGFAWSSRSVGLVVAALLRAVVATIASTVGKTGPQLQLRLALRRGRFSVFSGESDDGHRAPFHF